MIDTRILDEVSESLSKMLPPGMSELKADFERNTRAAMQGALAKMDLVTREEFDVQAALLARSREKLDLLEARVAMLEAKLNGHVDDSATDANLDGAAADGQ